MFRMLFLFDNPKYVNELVLLWVADRFLLEDCFKNSVWREDLYEWLCLSTKLLLDFEFVKGLAFNIYDTDLIGDLSLDALVILRVEL